MTNHTHHIGRSEEMHAPKSDAVKAVEAAVRSTQACRPDEGELMLLERACHYRMFTAEQRCVEHGGVRHSGICTVALAALRRQLADETTIVDRVWKALGITTYEQAKGKAIDELVADQARVIAGLRDLVTNARQSYQEHPWKDWSDMKINAFLRGLEEVLSQGPKEVG